MKRFHIRACWALLAAAATTAVIASAIPAEAGDASASRRTSSPFMRVYGPTPPPIGYVLFCDRYPRECLAKARSNVRLEMTPRLWRQLGEINIVVNRTVEPASDADLYGVEEVWTYPYLRGDCEDYVLLKRRMLMDRGWPDSALLITVVRDEKRNGHAVLAVRTRQGDYLLDNKTDVIRPWREAPYEFIKRQSYLDPKIWVSLKPNVTRTPAHIAGTQAQTER